MGNKPHASKRDKPMYPTTSQAKKGDYKMTIVGEGGVGKTSLTFQFIHHHFAEEYG
jgi:GTPase SAR1 family protein